MPTDAPHYSWTICGPHDMRAGTRSRSGANVGERRARLIWPEANGGFYADASFSLGAFVAALWISCTAMVHNR